MGRIRKRIIKKKANIKKNVKLAIKRKQPVEGNKLTSEQQAKQNEMLKVMLARPQQILPQGTSQQNDELRQKLDSLTRHNINLSNETKDLRRLIAEGRDNTQAIHAEQRQYVERNRILDQNIRDREAEEDRLHEQQDRHRTLQRAEDRFNASTEAGRHMQEIGELDNQIYNTNREHARNEDQIRNNKLYHIVQQKRAELDNIQEAVAAQNELKESDEFKHPQKVLKDIYYNLYKKQQEKEINDEIIKTQKDIQRMDAETQAYALYNADFNKPSQPMPVLKKDGTPRRTGNGIPGQSVIVYQKDPKTKELILKSKAQIYTEQRAVQMKTKEEAQIELDRLKAEQENNKKMAYDITRTSIEVNNMQNEVNRLKAYQESGPYLDQLMAREKAKKAVEVKQQQIQHEKNMIETNKKMKALEAQSQVAAEFDPLQADVAGVQTQIKELGDNVVGILNNHLANIENSKQLDVQRADMRSTLESVLDRYNADDRTTANVNILRLIKNKTNNNLPDDIGEFSLYDMQRATEFMNLLGTRDPDLLTTPDKLDKFTNEDTFKNFEWKDIK